MAINPASINRNIAQLRMIYFQEILKVVDKTPNRVWEDTCLDFKDDNNELLKKEYKGFSYNGEYFPPSITKLRKSQLIKVAKPLHESLVEDFEELRKKFVDEWNTSKRAFRNMVNRTLAIAKTEQELALVIPQYVLDQVELVDFLPHPRAKGLDAKLAKEILADYPELKNIHQVTSIGKLI